MERKKAESMLQEVFKLDKFYDEQWHAIEKLLKGERVLLIHKTGFGKSLCFQFPAVLLDGVTVVFSPLIALMRDQVNYLNRLQISAKCINSEQDEEENLKILDDAKKGRIKILYIAPERQENQDWVDTVRALKIKMVVIDEAHCISVWGHDFRPSYRRIINLVKLLPSNFPVLAATATATEKVAKDIINQIGGNISYIRGNLLRDNFALSVIHCSSASHKMAWLAEFLKTEEGTGLIYTGTRADTELYARWLQHAGINAVSYNAGLDSGLRKDIEKGLMLNKWKCVVSTNALGMGIDKPDIRFIIHTQLPASPIHYYQEIGRAGRDGKPTKIVLLYRPEDKELPEVFIESAKPSVSKYKAVIDSVKKEPLSEREVLKKTNLKQTYVRVIKADLIDQKIIREAIYGRTKKLEFIFNSPEFNPQFFEDLRSFKYRELESMLQYAEGKSCRMNYLREYLGDKSESVCGKCDNDLDKSNIYALASEWKQKLSDFKSCYFPVIDIDLKTVNLVNGIAASYYGFTSIGSAIHKCKYENGGDFPEYLINQTVKAYKYFFKNNKFDLILYVPPTESGDLVKNFAVRLSEILKIPVAHKLIKNKQTRPQKVFQNGYLKRENIKDVFAYEEPYEIMHKNILLVDDIYDSGATIKEIGKMLTGKGVSKIAPLVIAKTIGGDIIDNA
jgi:ATP-dependent DNA helicase RecQ